MILRPNRNCSTWGNQVVVDELDLDGTPKGTSYEVLFIKFSNDRAFVIVQGHRSGYTSEIPEQVQVWRAWLDQIEFPSILGEANPAAIVNNLFAGYVGLIEKMAIDVVRAYLKQHPADLALEVPRASRYDRPPVI